MNHLFRFPHGLGDAVQFTVALSHLREFRPDWTIDVQARRGAHTLFEGLARRTFADDEPLDLSGYDSVQEIPWPECWTSYADSPSTKAERSLRETFGIAPLERLCRYEVHANPQVRQRARDYLTRLTAETPDADGRFNVALIHYQGNSARRNKNLDEGDIRALVAELLKLGVRPLLIDFDRRSGLVAQVEIQAGCHAHAAIDHVRKTDVRVGMQTTRPITRRSHKTSYHLENIAADATLWQNRTTGDGATLAALVAQSRLFVGIDSGPGHIAGATDTPTIIVWRRHHPLHFYGLSPNVTHLVADDHATFLHGDRATGEQYFASRYHSRVYRDLKHALPRLAFELLHQPDAQARGVLDYDHWLRAEHRAADAAVVREVYFDDCYRCGELTCRPRTIVDVGAHIGSFARRIHVQHPRAKIVCVEANPANLPALTANVANFAAVVPAACTYQAEPQQLLSTVFPGSTNTGASRLTPRGNWSWDRETYRTAGDAPTISLEAIQAEQGWTLIDLLKLDCEGSEFSILENCDLSRIGMIVGEFHGREEFERLVRRRFYDWRVRVFQPDADEIGLFWLSSPGAAPAASGEVGAVDFQTRWNTCNDCDQLHGACCTMTGLNARREARRADAVCPMSRWPGQACHCAGNGRNLDREERGENAMLRDFLASHSDGGRLLLRFPHGLGDHVQLTGVLLHLRKHCPRLTIDVACRAGTESMLAGVCRRTVRLGQEKEDEYDRTSTLHWPEPNMAYADSPSTKAERCLREVFEIQPEPALCRYELAHDAAAEERVDVFIMRHAETWFRERGCRGSERSEAPRGVDVPPDSGQSNAAGGSRCSTPGTLFSSSLLSNTLILDTPRVVLFHTQGRCGRRLKDLDDGVLAAALAAVREAGCLPVLLDWSRGNAFVRDGLAIDAAHHDGLWETPGQGDGATLAALARRAALCVGIDSGPGHVFAATHTPTIIVWKLLHPVNYFAPTINTTHWVPPSHGRFIRGRRYVGEAYFAEHYQQRVYGDLGRELSADISRRLRKDG